MAKSLYAALYCGGNSGPLLKIAPRQVAIDKSQPNINFALSAIPHIFDFDKSQSKPVDAIPFTMEIDELLHAKYAPYFLARRFQLPYIQRDGSASLLKRVLFLQSKGFDPNLFFINGRSLIIFPDPGRKQGYRTVCTYTQILPRCAVEVVFGTPYYPVKIGLKIAEFGLDEGPSYLVNRDALGLHKTVFNAKDKSTLKYDCASIESDCSADGKYVVYEDPNVYAEGLLDGKTFKGIGVREEKASGQRWRGTWNQGRFVKEQLIR